MIQGDIAAANSSFIHVQIYDQQNIFDQANFGHPYRPTRSSFLFVKKGRLRVREQINEFEIIENSIFLIDVKYVYEIIEITPDAELRLLSYDRNFLETSSFKLHRLKVYRDLKTQLQRNFHLTQSEIDIFWTNVESLGYYLKNFNDVEYGQYIIENYFNIILYHLVSVATPRNEESINQMTSQQKITYKFVMLVSDHYLETKSVQFYADSLQLSIRHLSSVVKETSGKTPNEIINEFIFNEAKAQLSTTTIPIKQLASKLNFSDQYAFAHFFKKHQSISPTQYRGMFKL
ncbi:helix-turn-helix domain-containing protein [Myroides marinus]|uniref:helix-turn-helix domain-containing protein n=1 Tax=Myroides marinus TaxID=703342 RepID=UPI0025783EDA|nr:AraC family transcriptional regulator [Myroides marinus]MDM1371553.1 AraC family transcriptional regulator [Myroides marinus]MDM1375002.1 AraC family transcriptional regulator [Myroides marinus]MDM1379031.1 AraC family transcriptional regulator [Myroides marinus]MDM1386302.1 AraC family transcriptional regulator [Myroides marinus]MDM1393628.1 AraC family transcriptional regulator [Myroides marinus]